MNRGPVKILVAEWIPPFNKGELAILNGILKTFEAVGDVEVSVFSFYPQIDRPRYPRDVRIVDVEESLYIERARANNLTYGRSKVYRQWAISFAAFQHLMFAFLYRMLGRKTLLIMEKPLWKVYSECDVVITCTDEVDCVNGSALKFSPIYLSWLAKVLRKPIVFYANGTDTGSLIYIWRGRSRRLWRFLAKYILSLVDLVTVREEGTFLFFKEISHGKAPICLTADPAFLLCPVQQERVNEIMLREKIEKNDGPLIGVEMSHRVLSKAFKSEPNPKARYENAVKEVARILDRLIEEYSSTIVFVSHAIEPVDYRDDRIVSRDIYRLMSNKRMTRIITREYSAEEWKGLFGELRLLISCRVHAAISALSIGTPTCLLALSDDRRAHNIIGKMAKQEEWICDVDKRNPAQLFTYVSSLLRASGTIRECLPSIVNVVKEKAMLNGRLLKNLLESYSIKTRQRS